MTMPTLNAEAARLFETLAPELKKLCANATSHCDLRMIVTLHEGDVVLVSLGIDTKRKIAPRAVRGGGL
jgi:hypothetical protein